MLEEGEEADANFVLEDVGVFKVVPDGAASGFVKVVLENAEVLTAPV